MMLRRVRCLTDARECGNADFGQYSAVLGTTEFLTLSIVVMRFACIFSAVNLPLI